MVDELPNDRSKKPRKAKKPRSNSDSNHQRFDVVAQQAEPASAEVVQQEVTAAPEQAVEAPQQAVEPKPAVEPVAVAKPAAPSEAEAPAAPHPATETEQQQPRPARRRSRAKNDPRNNR